MTTDDPSAAVAARYRKRMSPSELARARIWRRVEQTVRHEGCVMNDFFGSQSRRPTFRPTGPIVLMIAAGFLVLTGLLGSAMRFAMREDLALVPGEGAVFRLDEDRRVGSLTRIQDPRSPEEAGRAALVAQPPSLDGSQEVTRTFAAEDIPGTLGHRTASSKNKVRSKSRPSAAEPDGLAVVEGWATLNDEMALLRRARRVLAAGDPKGTIAILEDHRTRFPAGQMIEDRDALRVRALCALSDSKIALRAADDFVRTYPASPYAARMAKGCEAWPEHSPVSGVPR